MAETLTKELTWLYKTGESWTQDVACQRTNAYASTSAYNICAEHCHEWDTALAKAMFGVTAEIMSFLLDRGQLLDAETAQKLALCRLAYLVALTEEARACGDNAKRVRPDPKGPLLPTMLTAAYRSTFSMPCLPLPATFCVRWPRLPSLFPLESPTSKERPWLSRWRRLWRRANGRTSPSSPAYALFYRRTRRGRD